MQNLRHVLLQTATVTAIRAQGAGGQNVNKVSSAAHLRFDIHASTLPPVVKERLLAIGDQRISQDGVIVIKAQEHRSLVKNRQDALTRLQLLVQSALMIKKIRTPTKPTKSATLKRLDNKSHQKSRKISRTKVFPDET